MLRGGLESGEEFGWEEEGIGVAGGGGGDGGGVLEAVSGYEADSVIIRLDLSGLDGAEESGEGGGSGGFGIDAFEFEHELLGLVDLLIGDGVGGSSVLAEEAEGERGVDVEGDGESADGGGAFDGANLVIAAGPGGDGGEAAFGLDGVDEGGRAVKAAADSGVEAAATERNEDVTEVRVVEFAAEGFDSGHALGAVAVGGDDQGGIGLLGEALEDGEDLEGDIGGGGEVPDAQDAGSVGLHLGEFAGGGVLIDDDGAGQAVAGAVGGKGGSGVAGGGSDAGADSGGEDVGELGGDEAVLVGAGGVAEFEFEEEAAEAESVGEAEAGDEGGISFPE